MEILQNAVQRNKFPADFCPDTDSFYLALSYYRSVYCDRTPFQLMVADQRAIVLQLAQQFKSGLEVCEYEERVGMDSDNLAVECSRIGTVCDLESERLVCLEHFMVNR